MADTRARATGTVRPATRADVPELGSVLSRAFEGAPQFAWLLPDPEIRARTGPVFFAAALRAVHPVDLGGEVIVEGGAIRGGAAWMPPGRWRMPAWRQLPSLPALIRALGMRQLAEFGKRGQALEAALHAAHPSEPHWYLAVLGTGPAVQAQGVGSALMRSGIARCDREGADAYLECLEALIPFYERFGFAVTAAIPMPARAPVQFGMWREARPS